MSAEQILTNMAAYAGSQTPQLTDLLPGSIFRSLLEAVAGELERIEDQSATSVEAAVREAAYQIWGFDRQAASAASGTLRVTATAIIASPISIPAGTQSRVPGTDRTYRTLAAATFPAGALGSTLDLSIASIGAGTAYNTPASTITEWLTPPSVNLSISNPSALRSGRDEETDEALLQRFQTFLLSLHRATADSLSYAALQAQVVDGAGVVIEQVERATVLDISRGLARCYVANSARTAPSADLLLAVEEEVADIKAAGVTIEVVAAALSATAVELAVRLEPTSSLAMVQAAVQAAIEEVISALEIGEPLYISQLERAALEVPGVVDAVVSIPADTVDPGEAGLVALSGAATVSEL